MHPHIGYTASVSLLPPPAVTLWQETCPEPFDFAQDRLVEGKEGNYGQTTESWGFLSGR